MTTLSAVHTALTGLVLSGVTNLTDVPADLSTAVIPVKWVNSIGVSEAPLRSKTMGGRRTLRAQVIVVTDAIALDRRATRWAAALAMVDTLNTGLKTLTSVLGYLSEWEIDVDPTLGSGNYIGVVATIRIPEYTH